VNSILETISQPQQLKGLSYTELERLAQEVRARILEVLSVTGGHLSSNLGVVELTIALHYVFDSPKDKLIFDIGHQSYTHKLLTGRNLSFPTLRQSGGISGFTSPQESPHDIFYSGHAGNSLSLALGVAKNRDLRKGVGVVIPIIGDAALTCGLALEAMNNIPLSLNGFVIVLNDNAMAISKNVGAITNILGAPVAPEAAAQARESAHVPVSTATFFEQFGLSYVGPVDGHAVQKMVEVFEKLKDVNRPTLVHLMTVKGQGMQHAIDNPTPYHGAKPFNRITGEFHPPKSTRPTFPEIFGKYLLEMAKKNPNLVAITPAMPVGSCLEKFMKHYPERCCDVGIAEGHSLTYAGGMGHGGALNVVACVYSSFLQRAFDNIYHDICVQCSPVVIAIDRGGLAAGDGITAHGLYDIGFLNSIPHMIIAQPRNGHLLKELLESAFDWHQPAAIRYPNLPTAEENIFVRKREVGKGELLAAGSDVTLISLGHMCHTALETRTILSRWGIAACVIDPIFIKPLDKELLLDNLLSASCAITIEEHALQGGLGSIINNFIVQNGLTHLKVKNFGIPDEFIGHGNYSDLLEQLGLTPAMVADEILQMTPQKMMV